MAAAKTAAGAWLSRLRHWHESSREPGLSALLVLETALIFLIIPLTGMGLLPQWVLQAVFAALIISILAVTWHSHAATIAVLAAVAVSLIGTLLWREDPTPLTDWLSAGGRLVAITALSIVIGRVVFGSGRVTIHRVQGSILLYLNLGLFFFTIYRLMSLLSADALGAACQPRARAQAAIPRQLAREASASRDRASARRARSRFRGPIDRRVRR